MRTSPSFAAAALVTRALGCHALHSPLDEGSSAASISLSQTLSPSPLKEGSDHDGRGAAVVTSQRPNVLLVLLDDAGAADVAGLGHPLLHTPQIDGFLRGALRFSQAYAGAPNCSPSRAALLTGRAPYRTGVYDFLSKKTGDMHLSLKEVTVAALLQAVGYATVHVGKWHLSRGRHGAPPVAFGFEHSNSTYAPASVLVPALLSWIHVHRRGRPFFAYLALWEPHEPVELWSPAQYRQRYGGAILPEASEPTDPVDGLELHAATQGSRAGSSVQVAGLDGALGSSKLTIDSLAPLVPGSGGGGLCAWHLPAGKRGPARVYYGCMSQVDDSFGRLLLGLEASGLRHNTLLVLTSDNGPEHRTRFAWGSTGGLRGAKGFVYEGGIRVPFIVQWPARAQPPQDLPTPIHFWDVLPTFLEAAGAPLPQHTLDGVSLLQLIDGTAGALGRGESQVQRQAAPPHVDGHMDSDALDRRVPLWWAMHRGRGGMQYALRDGAWKLVAGYGDTSMRPHGPPQGGEVSQWLRSARLGRAELYRVSHDPTERLNLARFEKERATQMLARLQTLVHDAAASGPRVTGWGERSPPCPRFNRRLNITEVCCSSTLVFTTSDVTL